MSKNFLKETEKTAQELLSLMGLTGSMQASEDKANDAVLLQLETEDARVLIGHHGETISAFQMLLGQILRQRTGEWKRILVNVGDWRERREETLRNLARSAASRVKETGDAQPIYDLTPSERRIVHMELSDDSEVTTESEGEGRDRHLVVKPRKS